MARSASILRIPLEGLTPAQISQAIFWYEADSLVTADGSNVVSAWGDKLGLSSDLTQATAGLRPTRVTNVINGLPVIRHTAAGAHTLTGTSPNASTVAHSMFAVFRENAAGPGTFNGIFYMGGLSGNGQSSTIGQESANNLWFGCTGDGTPTVGPLANGEVVIAGKIVTGSVVSAWKNGKKYVNRRGFGGVANYALSPANGIGTGKFYTASSTGNHDIAMMVGFSRAITEHEMEGLMQYARNKYVASTVRSASAVRTASAVRSASA